MILGASGFKKKSMYPYGSNPRRGANVLLRSSAGNGSPSGGTKGSPALGVTVNFLRSVQPERIIRRTILVQNSHQDIGGQRKMRPLRPSVQVQLLHKRDVTITTP